MKTRFRTSNEYQNYSILENKNFLNNQNYILWKTEKKKLLSKFFVEKSLNNFLTILDKISYFLLKYNFFILKVLSLLLFIIYILNIFFNIWIFSYLIYILPILIIIFWLNIKKPGINNVQNFNSNSYQNYFLSSSSRSLGFSFVFIFISILTTLPAAFYLSFNYNIEGIEVFKYLIPIWLFLFFIFKITKDTIVQRLSMTVLLILPFIIFIFFFKAFYWLVYTFILRWIEKYEFFKFWTKTKFLTKFEKFNKDFAINEYYLVFEK
jgi:hypothetical protein